MGQIPRTVPQVRRLSRVRQPPRCGGLTQLGPALERAVANAKRELLLAAPFIKALEKVLERVDVESLRMQLPVETHRDSPRVSDLEIYSSVRDHGGKLSLRQDLHANTFEPTNVSL